MVAANRVPVLELVSRVLHHNQVLRVMEVNRDRRNPKQVEEKAARDRPRVMIRSWQKRWVSLKKESARHNRKVLSRVLQIKVAPVKDKVLNKALQMEKLPLVLVRLKVL